MSSDDDRFEALVRSALHEEEPSLPVRITAAELRARAGARRGRWSLLMSTRSWLGALVPIAVLVAVVAIFTIGPLGSTPVGGTPAPSLLVPTLAPASPGTLTPTPTLPPTPTPPTIDLGASGDWVLVAVADDGTIHVRSVGADEERPLYETQAPLPYPPTGNVFAVSTEGHLAIEVVADGSVDPTTLGTWLVDMRDTRDPGQLLPGGSPAFGPTGDLVTFTDGGSNGTRTIRRYGFGANGDVVSQSELPVQVAMGVLPVFAPDGGGLFTSGRIIPPVQALLRWDGTTAERPASMAPWFRSGIERPTSRSGVALVGSSWRLPDGSTQRVKLPDGVRVDDAAWTRDGKTLVFASLARGRAALYAMDADDRATVRRLSALPGLDARITGMTDEAAIVTVANRESVAVALDGTGTIGGHHEGVPALIVP